MRCDHAALAVVLAASLTAVSPAAEKAPKPKRPQLELRALPQIAFAPVTVMFSVDLEGGDDIEEYYCPEVEWDWDDGGKSVKGGDCPPFEPGITRIERHFTAEHEFRTAGGRRVKVTLRRAGKPVARTEMSVTVRPGVGEGFRD